MMLDFLRAGCPRIGTDSRQFVDDVCGYMYSEGCPELHPCSICPMKSTCAVVDTCKEFGREIENKSSSLSAELHQFRPETSFLETLV